MQPTASETHRKEVFTEHPSNNASRPPENEEFARPDGAVTDGAVIPADDVPAEWDLRLYVAGQTPKSITAFTNLKKVCEEHLAGKYRIEIVDLLKDPLLAQGDQIVAIPTLVRKLPEPVRKIIGDLSNTERVLVGLQLRARHVE